MFGGWSVFMWDLGAFMGAIQDFANGILALVGAFLDAILGSFMMT